MTYIHGEIAVFGLLADYGQIQTVDLKVTNVFFGVTCRGSTFMRSLRIGHIWPFTSCKYV